MYRNVVYNARNEEIILFTWDEQGNRIVKTEPFRPYILLETPKGSRTSIFGTKVEKKYFKNYFLRNQFLKESGITRIFENFNPTQQFLIDNYYNLNDTENFTKNPLKILFFDIETYNKKYKPKYPVKIKHTESHTEKLITVANLDAIKEKYEVWDEETEQWSDIAKSCYKGDLGFPDIDNPDQEINIITCYNSLTRQYYTFATKTCKTVPNNVDHFMHYPDEKTMLKEFINWFQEDYPDILSGWGSEFFDIPYIINRITKILGEEYSKKLSPINYIRRAFFTGKFGKQQMRYYIEGISCIDYLEIYKKFCFKERPSYRLDAIVGIELKESKTDYGDMSLSALADINWDKFVEYNVHDVELLVKLEEKLQYISLLRMLAYTGLCQFENALGTLTVVNGAVTIQARHRNEHTPTFVKDKNDENKIPGGHVAEPKQGFQQYVVSYDVNSLYPNLMITLNLSPETKIGKIIKKDKDSISIHHVSGKTFTMSLENFVKFIKKEKIAISKAGVLFTQKRKGLIPEFIDGMYKKRVEIQKELAKKEKKLELLKKNNALENEIESIKTDIQRLNTKQYTIKICMNSAYGYMGNKYAPIGDEDIATSITMTGQAAIKQAGHALQEYLRTKYNVIDKDTLEQSWIYGDTDSYPVDTQLVTNMGIFDAGSLWNEFETDNMISCYGHEIKPVNNLFVETYDKNTKKVKLGKIKNLIRHKVSKDQYEIFAGKKSIKMTSDHGCLIIRNNELIRVSASEIKPGDKMIIRD